METWISVFKYFFSWKTKWKLLLDMLLLYLYIQNCYLRQLCWRRLCFDPCVFITCEIFDFRNLRFSQVYWSSRLSVCMYVCGQLYAKTTERNRLKFSGMICYDPRTNRLDFGSDWVKGQGHEKGKKHIFDHNSRNNWTRNFQLVSYWSSN